MAVVAPVGDEVALSAVADRGLGPGAEVFDGVVAPARQGTPARGAGADVEANPRFGERLGLLVEGVFGFVAPVQQHRIAGQALDEFGVVQHDVAPEHRGLAVGVDLLAEPGEVVEVDRGAALALDAVVAAALADVHRLVAADVEQPRARGVRQLADHVARQLKRPRVAGVEGKRLGAAVAPGRVPAVGALGQLAVGGLGQPVVEVAEDVLAGHEVDEAGGGVVLEFFDLLGGERGGVLPDALVTAEGEGVFGVELQLVELEARHRVDDVAEVVHGRHAVAADVEQVAAGGQVGPVFDGEAGQRGVGGVWPGLGQLLEGLLAVEDPRGVVADDLDAVRVDAEAVALGLRDSAGVDGGDGLGLVVGGRVPAGPMFDVAGGGVEEVAPTLVGCGWIHDLQKVRVDGGSEGGRGGGAAAAVRRRSTRGQRARCRQASRTVGRILSRPGRTSRNRLSSSWWQRVSQFSPQRRSRSSPASARRGACGSLEW